jgi:hypothetical protein
MDNLKEKLGMVILPYLSDFIDEMMKPGGAIDQVGKFLEDVSNPKTEAGQMFLQVKDAVTQTINGVKEFFALFGNGDAMKGFANIATQLVKMLPALLVLKGIMMLASAGKAIQSLVTAMTIIQGKNALPTGGGGAGMPGVVAPGAGVATRGTSLFSGMAGIKALSFLKLAPMIGVGMGGNISEDINPATGKTFRQSAIDAHNAQTLKTQPQNNIFNITVANADPKAVVDAIAKYVKQNGALPAYLTTGQARR